MSIYAKIILDSISPSGDRLTTLEVRLHRFVLSELNTFRASSKNSASSRAIPVENQLARVVDNPAFPILWASEQPGMQGGDELSGDELEDALELFADVHDYTTMRVRAYLDEHPLKPDRLHKSLINRLLEPFMWHTVIISATEAGWQNFFNLRCSPLAQPELRVAAEAIKREYDASTPTLIGYDGWHMPYLREDDDFSSFPDPLAAMRSVSVARCARVSYLTHDGVRDLNEDIAMYERLTSASPPHSSPLEHVATPSFPGNEPLGNFDGWHQLRHWPY